MSANDLHNNVRRAPASSSGLEADVLDEVRFQKQCFLSYNLLQIIEQADPIVRALPAGVNERRSVYGGAGDPRRQSSFLPQVEFGNLSSSDTELTIGGTTAQPIPVSPNNFNVIRGAYPADITAFIVGHPEIASLLNQKPYLLSFFVPHIRLYKVVDEWNLIRNSNWAEGIVNDNSLTARQGLDLFENVLRVAHGLNTPNPDDVVRAFRQATGVDSNGRLEGGTVEIEFLFDHKTNKEDIRMMMESRQGRAGGVGLKSFSWEFLGVNPAEVENNIKANLQFYFNDINEFDRERSAVNLPNLDVGYRFSDLIIAEPLRHVNANSPGIGRARDSFNPDHFRLKAVVGWSLKPKNRVIEETYSGEDYDRLVQLTEQSRKVLYLTLLRHDLNFNQDGSVELSVEYQAYAESVFSHPESDILNVRPRPDGQTDETQRRYDEISENVRSLSDIRRNCGGSQRQESEELDTLQELATKRRDEIDEELQLERARDKSYAYQRIMERLVQSNRIFTIVAPQENLGMGSVRDIIRAGSATSVDGERIEGGDLSSLASTDDSVFQAANRTLRESVGAEAPEGSESSLRDPEVSESTEQTRRRAQITGDRTDMRRLFARRRYAARDTDFEVRWYGQPVGVDYRTNNNAGIPDGLLLDSLRTDFSSPEEYENFVQTQIQGFQERMEWSRLSRTEDSSRQNITFDFMFFGDILDVILEGCSDWLTRSNIAIYLGTFPYTSPQEADIRGADSATAPVSLAYIPISIELFSMWFLEEIVEPQRNRMTVQQFMRSVFDKLIINSFGSDCVWDQSGLESLTQERISVVPEFYEVLRTTLQSAGMTTGTIERIEAEGSTDQVTQGRLQVYNYDDPPMVLSPQAELDLYELQREGQNYLDRYQGNTIEYDIIKDFNEPILTYEEGRSYEDYVHMLLYQDQTKDHTIGELFERVDFGAEGFVYSEQVQRDSEVGVYHLNLGSDRGLVKKIEFKRIDQDYALEARIAASGELGSFDQLRERYNATVTMYGNSFFYPGQHVYLNPSMMGVNAVPNIESMTTKLGLGGYFVVTKVENVIESGLYETILECSWLYSGFRIDTAQRECPDREAELQRISNALGIQEPEPPSPPSPTAIAPVDGGPGRDNLGLSARDYDDLREVRDAFRGLF